MHSQATILATMDAAPAAARFAELIHELYLRLYQRVDPRRWRPSREAALALQHLASTGPLTVTEAARHFDRSQAAMSELIARLEARGLLTRITDDRDRRRHLVWLTDHGHEALRRLTQVLSLDHLESALERMSGHDRQALIDLMTELLRAADDDARGTRKAP